MKIAEVPVGCIVVGVDGSEMADTALQWAAEQADLERRHLIVFHALQPLGMSAAGSFGSTGIDYGRQLDAERDTADTLLATALRQARTLFPGVRADSVLGFGDPRVSLLDLAEGAFMVVIGTRGLGPVKAALLGSVSAAVARHAHCPVVVMRPGETASSRTTVLLAVDGTESSRPAIELAYRMAATRGMTLAVVHCYGESPRRRFESTADASAPNVPWTDLEDQKALVAEALAGMAEKFPDVVVEVRLVIGFTVGHLIDASASGALLVLGHRHASYLDAFVHGSVAIEVLEHARCSVIVVPSDS